MLKCRIDKSINKRHSNNDKLPDISSSRSIKFRNDYNIIGVLKLNLVSKVNFCLIILSYWGIKFTNKCQEFAIKSKTFNVQLIRKIDFRHL